jgi:polyphosphate kinase
MAELAIDRARPDTTTEAALLPPSQRYINRELSWLAFNERVLEEASNSGHPLLERVRFLSISDSNLDEFYMVRVAALKELAASGLPVKSDDGLPPEQQLAAIAEVAAGLVQRQQRCWADLQKRLHAEGISILDHEALTGEDRAWLRQLFIDRLLPVLTPIAIDPAHPFPLIPNRALAIVVELHREDEAQINALVLVPERVDRFIRLPGEQARFILVEEVLLAVGLAELFPGMKPLGHGLFRALRNSDIEIEEKAQDLVVMFESAL